MRAGPWLVETSRQRGCSVGESPERLPGAGYNAAIMRTGYFSGFSIITAVAGVGFLCVSLIFWWFGSAGRIAILFGTAMLFVGLANSLAFRVLHRMELAGYEVGFWRTHNDFKLYGEYWRIAPLKGWSRWTLTGSILCFVIGALFLFSSVFGGAVLK